MTKAVESHTLSALENIELQKVARLGFGGTILLGNMEVSVQDLGVNNAPAEQSLEISCSGEAKSWEEEILVASPEAIWNGKKGSREHEP